MFELAKELVVYVVEMIHQVNSQFKFQMGNQGFMVKLVNIKVI